MEEMNFNVEKGQKENVRKKKIKINYELEEGNAGKIGNTIIKKEKLEKAVWEKPIKDIASEFNCNSSVIKNLCEKWVIKKPPLGYWTRQNFFQLKEQLQELVNQKPISQLSKELDVSVSIIDKRCQELGIKKPELGKWKRFEFNPTKENLQKMLAEKTINQIAEELNMHPNTVRLRCKRLGVCKSEKPKDNSKFNPTKEELKELVRTQSLRQIAKSFGISHSVVSKKCRDLGIMISNDKKPTIQKINLTKEELLEAVNKFPFNVVALQLKVDETTLRRACRRYGVEILEKGKWRRKDFPITKSQLIELVQKHPLTEIATALKIPFSLVFRRCKMWQIQTPGRAFWYRQEFNPKKEELQAMVQIEPFIAIAKRYGIDQSVVASRCEELGIETPESGYWKRPTKEEIKAYLKKHHPHSELLKVDVSQGPTKIFLRCGNKQHHSFWIVFGRLKSRNRLCCPQCDKETDWESEKACRIVVGRIFNKPFSKAYPSWLKNREGRQLHLDMYDEQLGLAFEYNGQQHYEFIPFFHQNIDKFHQQQENDRCKRQLCKKYNITLIDIPYSVKLEKMREFIIRSCIRKGKLQIEINSSMEN